MPKTYKQNTKTPLIFLITYELLNLQLSRDHIKTNGIYQLTRLNVRPLGHQNYIFHYNKQSDA